MEIRGGRQREKFFKENEKKVLTFRGTGGIINKLTGTEEKSSENAAKARDEALRAD